MLRRTFAAAVITGLMMSASASAQPAPDPVTLLNSIGGHVHFAWQQREFTKLEAWANDYRVVNVRTPIGNHYLPLFYSGFGQAFRTRDQVARARGAWENAYSEWQKSSPRSATPHIAHAKTLISEAWLMRGNGYAHQVWDEDAEKFAKLMQDARDVLVRHQAITSTDPYFYVLMAETGKALSEDAKVYFERIDEGLKKFPKFLSLYYDGAEFLTPKWGGSKEAFLAWADHAATQTRAREGLGLYARLFVAHRGDEFAQELIAESPEHRQKLKQGMADWMSRYPTAAGATDFMPMACALKDPDAVEVLRKVVSKATGGATVWNSMDVATICNWQPVAATSPSVLPPPQPGADGKPRLERAKGL